MNKDRLREALEIDYRLRSTFFHRKIHELGFFSFAAEVNKLVEIEQNFNWDNRVEWGLTAHAWNAIVTAQISPLMIFAHPRVLQEQPKLSAYYRNVAVLPQKAVNKLAFTITNIEKGKRNLSSAKALQLCKLYNAHTSLIIESATDYTVADALALMYTSAGAQINGSWLNKIGEEGELITRKILVRAALQEEWLVSAIRKDGTTTTNTATIIEQVTDLAGIRLKNQTSILFASEPDISFLDASGALVAVIEVKGGKDTAGALERYGAAKKSFEEALRESPQAHTIFLASCITQEVEKRLAEDQLVNSTVNLTEVVSDESQRAAFVRFSLGLLGINLE